MCLCVHVCVAQEITAGDTSETDGAKVLTKVRRYLIFLCDYVTQTIQDRFSLYDCVQPVHNSTNMWLTNLLSSQIWTIGLCFGRNQEMTSRLINSPGLHQNMGQVSSHEPSGPKTKGARQGRTPTGRTMRWGNRPSKENRPPQNATSCSQRRTEVGGQAGW